jgi:predicted transcriptional regulator
LTETLGIEIIIKADVDMEKEKLDFQSALDAMEKGGLIIRTTEGKICLTKKGQRQQLRGFSIKGPAHK